MNIRSGNIWFSDAATWCLRSVAHQRRARGLVLIEGPPNSMQRTAPRAAADAERSADKAGLAC